MNERDELPLGRVGRVLGGRYEGFWVLVDDDTNRPKGTGGYSVLWWTPDDGHDDWVEDLEGVADVLESPRSNG